MLFFKGNLFKKGYWLIILNGTFLSKETTRRTFVYSTDGLFFIIMGFRGVEDVAPYRVWWKSK